MKHHTRQRLSEGSKKPYAHKDPETPQRLRQNCVLMSPTEVWVCSGLLQGQGLWVEQTWVWHKPSWRRLPLTPPEPTELMQNWGYRLFGGHKQNLVYTRTQEKGAVTPQETDPYLPVSVEESPEEAWVGSGLLQGWGHWVQQCMHGTF